MKDISQDELAKHLGPKSPVIGLHELNGMKPFIEADEMAHHLRVSLD